MTFNMSFPEKSRSLRKCDNGLYWYNQELRDMREKYIFLNSLYNEYRTDELLQMRNLYRGQYRREIDSAKKLASSRYISNSTNKPKAMWNLINGGKRSEPTLPNNVNSNDMNNFFVNMTESLVTPLAVFPICCDTKCLDNAFSFKCPRFLSEISCFE